MLFSLPYNKYASSNFVNPVTKRFLPTVFLRVPFGVLPVSMCHGRSYWFFNFFWRSKFRFNWAWYSIMCIFFYFFLWTAYEHHLPIKIGKKRNNALNPSPVLSFHLFIYLFLNKLPSFTLACKACCGHYIFEN